ncbi:MAG: hypothetical protein IMW99_10075, partial [Firmicutes bacterium]|nr:hypothetical protein [Bacillota bacterium]
GPEGPAEAVERGPVLEPAQEPPDSRPREQAGPRPAGSAAVSAPALEEAGLRTLPASPEAPAARGAADRRAGESRRPPRPRRPPWLIR